MLLRCLVIMSPVYSLSFRVVHFSISSASIFSSVSFSWSYFLHGNFRYPVGGISWWSWRISHGIRSEAAVDVALRSFWDAVRLQLFVLFSSYVFVVRSHVLFISWVCRIRVKLWIDMFEFELFWGKVLDSQDLRGVVRHSRFELC